MTPVGPATARAQPLPGGGTSLRVYKGMRPVGTLVSDTSGRVAFAYDEAVLGDPSAVVSLRLPVVRGVYDDLAALPCFENLLPEGDMRRMLATATHHGAGDVVGLLGVVGGECAGALSLWLPPSEPSEPPRYRDCTAQDVADLFGAANELARVAAALHTSRTSMSGAQEKIVLYRAPAVGPGPNAAPPRYRLPVAGAPSTVLLKRDRGAFPGLLHNELACMTLMEAAGVPTAPHAVHALDPSVYETARFDRTLRPDGTVLRHHAEDGCQITGRVSQAKYAETGGPTYAELVAVLNRTSVDPLRDVETLFRWAVTNLVLGNRDAHAKNVSVLHDDDGRVRLAPAYDVVCTLAYPTLEPVLPLRFGGQVMTSALTPAALRKAAREFGLTPRRAEDVVTDVCDRVRAALPGALHAVTQTVGAHPVLAIVERVVTEQLADVSGRLVSR